MCTTYGWWAATATYQASSYNDQKNDWANGPTTWAKQTTTGGKQYNMLKSLSQAPNWKNQYYDHRHNRSVVVSSLKESTLETASKRFEEDEGKVQQMLDIYDLEIRPMREGKQNIDIVYIDIAKAFDLVVHTLLF